MRAAVKAELLGVRNFWAGVALDSWGASDRPCGASRFIPSLISWVWHGKRPGKSVSPPMDARKEPRIAFDQMGSNPRYSGSTGVVVCEISWILQPVTNVAVAVGSARGERSPAPSHPRGGSGLCPAPPGFFLPVQESCSDRRARSSPRRVAISGLTSDDGRRGRFTSTAASSVTSPATRGGSTPAATDGEIALESAWSPHAKSSRPWRRAMTDTVAELVERGKALSAQDRTRLGEQLRETLDESVDSGLEDAWRLEIRSRTAAFERSDAKRLRRR
jgi:hypothetical protein